MRALEPVATARRAYIGLVWPSLAAFLAVSMLMRVEANWPLLAWASAAVYGPSILSCRLKRLCLQFACLTGSLGIVLAVIAGDVPDRLGPDRASDVFLSCVEAAGSQALVGLRYQDVALVRYGKDVDYFRPGQTKVSVRYDRSRAVTLWKGGCCAAGSTQSRLYRRYRTKPLQRLYGLLRLSREIVRKGGVEPPHPEGHRNLNPARLPIPPLSRDAVLYGSVNVSSR